LLQKYLISGIIDDFYLSLLDWGPRNLLAVAIINEVYLIDIDTETRKVLVAYDKSEIVSSLKFSRDFAHLAIGLRSGNVELWDVRVCRIKTKFKNHTQRVSVMDWNDSLLTTGSRDRVIINRDVRETNNFPSALEYQKKEVCGIPWNRYGSMLASGGNDNKLILWQLGYDKPIYEFVDHIAAIKALSWKPDSSGILCTGGGTADRSLKLWDGHQGVLLNSLDTGSQVCNVMWGRERDQLISTHGYSLNQISMWKCSNNNIIKEADHHGHSFRVLFLASNSERTRIATAAGDEVLKVWAIGNSESTERSFLEKFDIR